MHNFQSYFSKFSQGTCPQHALNTQKRPPSPKKHAKRYTFSQNMRKKIPLFPRQHAKRSTFTGKVPPQIQTWLRACIRIFLFHHRADATPISLMIKRFNHVIPGHTRDQMCDTTGKLKIALPMLSAEEFINMAVLYPAIAAHSQLYPNCTCTFWHRTDLSSTHHIHTGILWQH